MGASDFVVPLLGALQAALSVLLTIVVGVIAAQFGWLSEKSSKDISQVCVKLMLPSLLIYSIGSEINQNTAIRFVPVIVWSLVYNAISMAFGLGIVKAFSMPAWVTPAIAFNNTTSLPLLLIESLDAAGILASIDSSSGTVSRAKAYLLMNAMIGNSLTFALGPKLLNGQNEDAPDEKPEDEDERNGAIDREIEEQESEAEQANEETSLLPTRVIQPATRVYYRFDKKVQHTWKNLPPWLQQILGLLYAFINPPVIGAVIGIIIGLVPALHRVFFASQSEGGYLNAWLTQTIQNVGDLFAALQVIVVGVKLSTSLIHMKHGEAGGSVPWASMLTILVTRMVLWPAVSIPIVYALAKKGVIGDDPILFFCMMLMPTGPPALKLSALADVNGTDEEEKLTIAKFLTISYAVSPIIAFAVVGSLKATQAVG